MATREDTFVEVAIDTSLILHLPTGANAGSGWTAEEVTGTAIQRVDAANDYCESSADEGNDRHLYTLQPDPAGVEYDVQATLSGIAGSPSLPWFLIARLTDASNYYSAGSYNAGSAADKKIFKKVAGTVAEIASGDNGLTAGDTIKFEVRDAAKKLFHNGSEIISSADNALTSAGRAGFGVGNAWVATDDIEQDWKSDNFFYTEVAAAASAAKRRMMLGVGL